MGDERGKTKDERIMYRASFVLLHDAYRPVALVLLSRSFGIDGIMKKPLRCIILFLWTALLIAGCDDTGSTVDISTVPTSVAGELQLTLTTVPDPPTAGQDITLRVEVKDANGVHVEGAHVEMSTDMTTMRHGPFTGTLSSKGGGIYEGPIRFVMGGPWRVQLTATRADGSARTVGTFDIEVR